MVSLRNLLSFGFRGAAVSRSMSREHKSDRQALLKRLNRIAGQVRGVAGMVEEERYCVDVLTQIAAIRSALDAVAMQLLEDHAHGCVQEAMRAGRGDQAVDEFMTVVKRLSR